MPKTKNKTSKRKIPMDEKVEIGCPIHGSFFMTPRNHLNGWGCPACKDNSDVTSPFIKDSKDVIAFERKYCNLLCTVEFKEEVMRQIKNKENICPCCGEEAELVIE